MSATATSRATPAKINLRFREPTTGTTPAVGDVDLNLQRRDAVIALVGGMPDDAYTPRLKPAIITATNALETLRGYIVTSIDDALELHDKLEGFIQQAAKEARAAVPQVGGYGSPASYEAAADEAEQKIVARNWANIRSTTIDATKDKAAKYAQDCVDGCTSLSREISACMTDYRLPAAIRGSGVGSSADDQRRIEGGERAYRGEVMPMAKAIEDWNGLEAANAPDDQVRLLIGAIRGVAIETRDMSLLKASERYPGRSNDADTERQRAWALLAEIGRWEASRQPASIGVALDCLALLRDTFRDLLGINHKTMTRGEFAAAFLSMGTDQVDSAVPWKLDSHFQSRFLPGANCVAYPGYSRIVGRSGMGVVYRAGAAAAKGR